MQWLRHTLQQHEPLRRLTTVFVLLLKSLQNKITKRTARLDVHSAKYMHRRKKLFMENCSNKSFLFPPYRSPTKKPTECLWIAVFVCAYHAIQTAYRSVVHLFPHPTKKFYHWTQEPISPFWRYFLKTSSHLSLSLSILIHKWQNYQSADQLWGPPSLLSNGYRRSFPGSKARPGPEADHSPHSI
jgi:hypothetical protein